VPGQVLTPLATAKDEGFVRVRTLSGPHTVDFDFTAYDDGCSARAIYATRQSRIGSNDPRWGDSKTHVVHIQAFGAA
jgi:hypothetical protein